LTKTGSWSIISGVTVQAYQVERKCYSREILCLRFYKLICFFHFQRRVRIFGAKSKKHSSCMYRKADWLSSSCTLCCSVRLVGLRGGDVRHHVHVDLADQDRVEKSRDRVNPTDSKEGKKWTDKEKIQHTEKNRRHMIVWCKNRVIRPLKTPRWCLAFPLDIIKEDLLPLFKDFFVKGISLYAA
jgi:hypothetical protein